MVESEEWLLYKEIEELKEECARLRAQLNYYKNAEPDEPVFVLLGRDKFAAHLVSIWSMIRMGKIEDASSVFLDMINKNAVAYHMSSKSDIDQAMEAIDCSLAMFKFYDARKEAKRTAELADESPGTPLGRLNVIGKAAEERGLCTGFETKPAEIFLIEAFDRLCTKLIEKEKQYNQNLTELAQVHLNELNKRDDKILRLREVLEPFARLKVDRFMTDGIKYEFRIDVAWIRKAYAILTLENNK